MSNHPQRSTQQTELRILLAYWLPVLAWMAVIFWFSSQSNLPQQPDPLLEMLVKKSAHAGEYAILGLLLLRAFGRGAPVAAPWPIVLAWIVAVLYAASDEFHQSFTPGRHPAPLDVLIDAAGVTIALLIAHRTKQG